MSEPRMFTKNYVTGDDVFAASHGSDFIARLYDRENESQYETATADDDDEEVTVECEFYEGAVAVDRIIDTVMLLNHNLKNPYIEYWDGSTWQTASQGVNLTNDNTVFSFTEVETSKIRIRCTDTQSPDEEKAVGEWVACLATVIPQDFVKYEVMFRQQVAEIPLADGSVHRAVVKHSTNRTQKYGARVQINFLAWDDLEELRAIKESGEAFLWQPESTARPDQVFLVYWVNPLQYRYAASNKDAGFVLDLEVREV